VEKIVYVLLDNFVLPHAKTPLLQDRMKGRHSEVDELSSLVAERRRLNVLRAV